MQDAVAQDAGFAGKGASWRSAVEVFKPRIGLEIMFAGIAGVAMAQGSGLPLPQLLVLAAAVFLAAASAGALNHLAERDLDARMSRTPVPSRRRRCRRT
jgi:heme o synthase